MLGKLFTFCATAVVLTAGVGRRQIRAARAGGPRRPALGLQVAAVLLLALATGPAPGQQISSTPRENLCVTNGSVYSVVESSGTIYLGGDFTHVGPATGSFVAIGDANGQWAPKKVSSDQS